jgi:class 3 adenylate cyclase
MTAPPTGTVTFLFTDIEGSTRLLQRLGDVYGDVLSGTGSSSAPSFGNGTVTR